MDNIAHHKLDLIIIFLNDKYLKSEKCIYELNKILSKSDSKANKKLKIILWDTGLKNKIKDYKEHWKKKSHNRCK